MVSLRCKMLVEVELNKVGLYSVIVNLGVVQVMEEVTMYQKESLKRNLLESGLELLEDRKAILVESIKVVIIEMIHHSEEFQKENYSDYISRKLKLDYTYLSNIFSTLKGMTIQQYIILNKVEKIKELLLYDELNLTQISYKLRYSSPAHLSNQFKKITGFTPSLYKKLYQKSRDPLENM